MFVIISVCLLCMLCMGILYRSHRLHNISTHKAMELISSFAQDLQKADIKIRKQELLIGKYQSMYGVIKN